MADGSPTRVTSAPTGALTSNRGVMLAHSIAFRASTCGSTQVSSAKPRVMATQTSSFHPK